MRDGDHYVLNGTKRYITNAPEAGIFTVMARTDPAKRGAGGISAFIVEADTPGLTLGKTDRKMGQRGAHTCDVVFENCRVPAANLIGGKEGVGFKTAMKVLDKGRLHIAAVCVGAAERMLDEALRYAMERKQFGQPIAEFQLVQAMLADSKAEIYAARCMVLDAARRRDDGEDVSTEASCCKLFASEMCGRVADRAVQIHGGAGYMSRVRGRALLPRRAPVPHLRGHEPDPAARHRPQHDQGGAEVMDTASLLAALPARIGAIVRGRPRARRTRRRCTSTAARGPTRIWPPRSTRTRRCCASWACAPATA